MNNSSTASLMVASFEQGVCIKVTGRANFTLSVDLNKLIDELWHRGCKQFVFDLSECINMDSTFLGVLSKIGLRYANEKGGPEKQLLELYNPHPRIREVLETLGVAMLFKICDRADVAAAQFETLESSGAASKVVVTRTCLEAHQTLMAINPENIKKFKDVAQFLADDLKRLESKDTKPEDPSK